MNTTPALLCIDSYKLGHVRQYPDGTEYVYSNMTPRSLRHLNGMTSHADDKLVAFGMHAAVKELHTVFKETFFDRPIDDVIEEFTKCTAPFLGDNTFPIEHIRQLHAYGRLPLTFRALTEGTVIKAGIPVLTVINTQPEFFWLTNYIETWLSAAMWKPMTAASIARLFRIILEKYAALTDTPKEFVDWQGHDFSTRGMSGIQDSAATGVGHLLFFTGTDNIPAAHHVAENYESHGLIGASIPATEHSVMSAGGADRELDTYRRLLTEVYPSGMLSIVSDTWDFWNVVTNYARVLKDDILARKPDANGASKLVFRPDSGYPVDIICGTAKFITHKDLMQAAADHTIENGVYVTERSEYWRVMFEDIEQITPTPEMMGAVECLWNVFGGTITKTGHRLLDSHVGLIYGDSITLTRMDLILKRLHQRGYASGNVVFGIGSYTYQYVTRDTLGTAMKATWIVVNGEPRVIFKKPATDDGVKTSAKGLLAVHSDENGDPVLEQDISESEERSGMLKEIYCDGRLIKDELSFDLIRLKARGYL